jgi:hypothetical protein
VKFGLLKKGRLLRKLWSDGNTGEYSATYCMSLTRRHIYVSHGTVANKIFVFEKSWFHISAYRSIGFPVHFLVPSRRIPG